jgi:hypothetical protein
MSSLWILKIAILSLLMIGLTHYLFEYLKNNFTKTIIRSDGYEKYKNIYEKLDKERSSPSTENETTTESKDAVIITKPTTKIREKTIDNTNKIEPIDTQKQQSMKNELRDFLKSQMKSTSAKTNTANTVNTATLSSSMQIENAGMRTSGQEVSSYDANIDTNYSTLM